MSQQVLLPAKLFKVEEALILKRWPGLARSELYDYGYKTGWATGLDLRKDLGEELKNALEQARSDWNARGFPEIVGIKESDEELEVRISKDSINEHYFKERVKDWPILSGLTAGYFAGLTNRRYSSEPFEKDDVIVFKLIRGSERVLTKKSLEKQPNYNLSSNQITLIEESSPNNALEIFASYIKSGHYGLCITTTPPSNIARIAGLEMGSFEQLYFARGDDAKKQGAVDPARLEFEGTKILGSFFSEQAVSESSRPAIVLVTGLDILMLTTPKGFKGVFDYATLLAQKVSSSPEKCYAVVSINPESFDKKEYAQLRSALGVLGV